MVSAQLTLVWVLKSTLLNIKLLNKTLNLHFSRENDPQQKTCHCHLSWDAGGALNCPVLVISVQVSF